MPPALLCTISNSWSFCGPEEEPLHSTAAAVGILLRIRERWGKPVAEDQGALASPEGTGALSAAACAWSMLMVKASLYLREWG